MSEDTATAIIFLAIVIAVIGAPFALNEYNRSHERGGTTGQSTVLNLPIITTPTLRYTYNPTPPPVPTAVQTPMPTIQPDITEGYWCRKTTMNIGKAPTDVMECYQFFTDGTFQWGYSPGRPMGKSLSCWAPNVKCDYSFKANGHYEVEGGYTFTLSGQALYDPLDPPSYAWSPTGIP